ncbi:hypothetical protein ACP0HM_01060 [Escherichia coli]
MNDCLLYVSQKNNQSIFLLSRIYDVVWCNNRKKIKTWQLKAINSYAEMLNIAIEKLIIKKRKHG